MYDKLATRAFGFYLQGAINFISKCGGIELCFKPRVRVKREEVRSFLIFSLLIRVIANRKSAFIDRLASSDSARKLSNYSHMFRLLEKRVMFT